MHLVIQWPDRWLAAAGSEQAYRERVVAALLSPVHEVRSFTAWERSDGTRLRQTWNLLSTSCRSCNASYHRWVSDSSLNVLRSGDIIGHVSHGGEGTDATEFVAWESPPPTPRCPLCHPVDSLRVDKLSPVDRVRLLQALADHDDVAECLAVEADRAQARLGGESHERPRAPADVLRIAELEAGHGFDQALLARAPHLAAFDIQNATLTQVECRFAEIPYFLLDTVEVNATFLLPLRSNQ